MNIGEEPLRIIGNESNQVYEIEPGSSAPAPKETLPQKDDKPNEPSSWNNLPEAAPLPSNDLATNDGSVIETLDTVFHNRSEAAESKDLAGSNRADYYEAHPNGQSDAEEEVNPSSTQ
jgi:hypothetical protein